MHDPATLASYAGDLPVEEMSWGTLRWLCSDRLQRGAKQTLGICHIYSGQSNPLHYHPNCEEVLHVLAGCGRHSIDGQWIDLRPGTTIRIPEGVKHKLRNDGQETMICLIAFSTGDRQTVFLDNEG